MNEFVVAAVAMGASSIGALATAVGAWVRASAGRRMSKRQETVEIKTSDGQIVKLVLGRNATDAEVGEAIARALRRSRKDDPNTVSDDHGASSDGGAVTD